MLPTVIGGVQFFPMMQWTMQLSGHLNKLGTTYAVTGSNAAQDEGYVFLPLTTIARVGVSKAYIY